jgi:uncharacterized protein involved in high-affinity Fe2+ transport
MVMKRSNFICNLLTVLGVLSMMALTQSAAQAQAPKPGAEAGFEEFPLGDEQEIGPLHINGVYFQPVDMEPAAAGGLPASQSDLHIEADISALANNELGYGAGDFIPNLTVRYKIQKEGGKLIEGTFMPMNASDGPHYGSNVKLDGPGKYKVAFIIESPEKQGYLLHVDKTTGVKGRFWSKPIEVTYNLDWVPRNW